MAGRRFTAAPSIEPSPPKKEEKKRKEKNEEEKSQRSANAHTGEIKTEMTGLMITTTRTLCRSTEIEC